MKTILVIAALVAVAAAANTHKKRSDDVITANVNDVVDEVATNIQNYIINHELDPLDLYDYTCGFSHKPLLITYSGNLTLTNGNLTNLSTLNRNGNAILSYEYKHLTFDSDFYAKILYFSYNYRVKIMKIGPTGILSGRAKKVYATANVHVDLANYNITLGSFDITKVKTVKTTTSGGLIYNWLTSLIRKIGVLIFKNEIVDTIEERMADVLIETFDAINAIIQRS